MKRMSTDRFLGSCKTSNPNGSPSEACERCVPCRCRLSSAPSVIVRPETVERISDVEVSTCGFLLLHGVLRSRRDIIDRRDSIWGVWVRFSGLGMADARNSGVDTSGLSLGSRGLLSVLVLSDEGDFADLSRFHYTGA